MINKSWIAVMMLLGFTFLKGQNLVLNQEIEVFSNCPTNLGGFSLVTDWSSPTLSSPEYFNTCNTSPQGVFTNPTVPLNGFGFQEPLSGNGYAGGYMWHDDVFSRDYFQVGFSQALDSGVNYYVEFWVSLSDSSRRSISAMGAYFSDTLVSNQPIGQVLPFSPQIESSPTLFLSDTSSSWIKISGDYIAQGNENYLIIGNFRDDPSTTTWISNPLASNDFSYYYLDNVSVQPCVPELDLGPDTTLCPTTTLDLDVFYPGATYFWHDFTQIPSHTISSEGVYSVEVSYLGCTRSDSIVINYDTVTVDLGNDTIICSGEILVLNATQVGMDYLWQDSSSLPAIIVDSGGIYHVTLSGQFCHSTDSIWVSETPNPEPSLGTDTILCSGNSYELALPGMGYQYEWFDESQDSLLTINQSALVWVIQTDQNGCSGSDSVVINFHEEIGVSWEQNYHICEGDTLTLASGLHSDIEHLWNNGATDTFITIDSSASIILSVVDTHLCESQFETEVYLHALPEIDFLDSNTVCYGDSLLLDAEGSGTNYLWQDGSIQPYLLVHQGGTYHVNVTNENECSQSDTIYVTFLDSLPFIFLGNDTSLCKGNPIVLDAGLNPDNEYFWLNGDTSSSILIHESGSYWVEVTDQYGCSNIDTRIVTYYDLPDADLGPDTSIEAGSFIVLNAGPPGNSYLWSNGETQNYIFGTTQNYWVEVTDSNGCTSRDSLFISVFVGFEELEDEISQVYPNPFSEILTVNWDKKIQSVQIFDLGGRLITEIESIPFKNSIKINTQDIPQGVYFITIQDEVKMTVQKIIKD